MSGAGGGKLTDAGAPDGAADMTCLMGPFEGAAAATTLLREGVAPSEAISF